MISKFKFGKWLLIGLLTVFAQGCAINSTVSFNSAVEPAKDKVEIKTQEVVVSTPVNKTEEPIETYHGKETIHPNKTIVEDKIKRIFVGCKKFRKPEIPTEIIIDASEIKNLNDQEIIKKLLDHIKKSRQQYLFVLKKYNESMVEHLKSCKN